ncbi:hypothetical protein Vi05172_g5235 [Venturia inaequalis]|nr:hypothetical protein Vi05172_g5235 [Venturia inaequalis]
MSVNRLPIDNPPPFEIDPDQFGKTINISSDPTTAVRNGWILYQIGVFASRKYIDQQLFEAFKDAFEDWELADFAKVDKAANRDLYNYLRQHGVPVKRRHGGGYGVVLRNMAQQDTYTPLTDKELQILLREYNGVIQSAANPNYIGSPALSTRSAFRTPPNLIIPSTTTPQGLPPRPLVPYQPIPTRGISKLRLRDAPSTEYKQPIQGQEQIRQGGTPRQEYAVAGVKYTFQPNLEGWNIPIPPLPSTAGDTGYEPVEQREGPSQASLHAEIQSLRAKIEAQLPRHFGAPQDEFGAPQADFRGPNNQIGAPQDEFGAPQADFRGPNYQIGAPQDEFGAPQADFRGPNHQIGAPQDDIGAPQGEVEGPRRHVGAPQGEVGGPIGGPRQVGAPQRNVGAPQGEFGGPRQVGAPQRNIRAPQGEFGGPRQVGAPQRNVGAPQGEVGGPMGGPRQVGGPRQQVGTPKPDLGAPQRDFRGPRDHFGLPQDTGAHQRDFGGPKDHFGAPQDRFGGHGNATGYQKEHGEPQGHWTETGRTQHHAGGYQADFRAPQESWERVGGHWERVGGPHGQVGREPSTFQGAPGRFGGYGDGFGGYGDGFGGYGARETVFQPQEPERDRSRTREIHENRKDFQQNRPQIPFAKYYQDLSKIFDKDVKYGGQEYEILQDSLDIFQNYCSKLEIPEKFHGDLFDITLTGPAKNYYFSVIAKRMDYGLKEKIHAISNEFENTERRQKYLGDWQTTSFESIRRSNKGKTKLECIDILIDTLKKIANALGKGEPELREQVIHVIRPIPECALAITTPSTTVEALRANLRSAMATSLRQRPREVYTSQEDDQYYGDLLDQYYGDRQYGGGREQRGRGRGRGFSRGRGRGGRPYIGPTPKDRICYVCGKLGCFSRNHSLEERKKSYEAYKKSKAASTPKETLYQAFLVEVASSEGPEAREDSAYLLREIDPELDVEGELEDSHEESWWTEEFQDEYDVYFQESYLQDYQEIAGKEGKEVTSLLQSQAAVYAYTKVDPFQGIQGSIFESVAEQPGLGGPQDYVFTYSPRYAQGFFEGIMPDTGAAGVSTGGHPQFEALQHSGREKQLL